MFDFSPDKTVADALLTILAVGCFFLILHFAEWLEAQVAKSKAITRSLELDNEEREADRARREKRTQS